MFTGIVENQAVLLRSQKREKINFFCFCFKNKETKVRRGESLAVNGVCLTAENITPWEFEVSVVSDTLKATTLGALKVGERVNLERSLRYGHRVAGHFVSGHIDGLGKIFQIESCKNENSFWIEFPPSLAPFMIPKGSVAVDGISLTLQSVKGNTFKVSLIPYTFKITTLGLKKRGDRVNLECDLFLKQQIHLKKIKVPRAMTLTRLIKQGF
ncbi:MAG: riboflavin synthase [Candidatus Omnitrophica bacterium]|nr:riboflavin synthase [Candidatus Omnitrophota bacterium]